MKDAVTVASTEEIENLKIPNMKKCTRDFLFFLLYSLPNKCLFTFNSATSHINNPLVVSLVQSQRLQVKGHSEGRVRLVPRPSRFFLSEFFGKVVLFSGIEDKMGYFPGLAVSKY